MLTIETGALSSPGAKTANKTISPKASAHEVQKVIISISIPICIFGLLGNGIVLVVFSCIIKKTKYTIYALNIAAADILNLLYHFIFFLVFLKPLYMTLQFALTFNMIYAFGYNAAFFILTVFCTERCLINYFPDWSQQHLSKIRAAVVCILLWGIACLITIVEFIVCQEKHDTTLSCWSAVVVKMFIEFLAFFPALVISVIALIIRTKKKTLPAPVPTVDITAIVTGVFFLIFDITVRLLDVVVFWTERTDLPLVSISILCDIICSSGNPFIFFFLGCWRQPRAWRPIHISLERAFDENVSETPPETEEPA